MLFIIELLFLFTGLWAVIVGKMPARLLQLLFGKGEYELSVNQSRLFGLLLSSPLPVSVIVALILTNLFSVDGAGYAIIIENVYILIIITVSIFIARKSRNSITRDINVKTLSETPIEKKTHSYGLRLLLMFGIVILGCITSVSAFSLIMVLLSASTVGTPPKGDFWSDISPFILMIIGIGLFGIFKLVKILRK